VRAAVVPIREWIDALAVARDLTGRAPEPTRARDAALARRAGLAGALALAVSRRPAVLGIVPGIDAVAAALDEARLAAQGAHAHAVAALARGTRAPARAAVVAVALEIDTLAT